MSALAALFAMLGTLLIGAISPGPSFVFVVRTAVAKSRADGSDEQGAKHGEQGGKSGHGATIPSRHSSESESSTAGETSLLPRRERAMSLVSEAN